MNDHGPDEEFDRFLSDSLSARPLPRMRSSLAARARARATELRSGGALETLARQWRWGLRVNMLAGAVLVAIFAALVPALLERASANIQSYTTYDSISADATASESANSQWTDSLIFGGSILLGAVLLVVVQNSLEGDNRSEIKFTAAMNPPSPGVG